ncbi:MAG: MAPEG family protein [Rhizobiales bacterium]|nr:MAPEG family protein [Hyphomicrobiales bacterium]MBI3674944.1 MAPEG family protein [Hyphomicrobiales bacterium]
MTTDLKMLAWVAGLTALMWVPYILARMQTSGIMNTLTYAADNDPLPAWAERAKRAHRNAVENLVPFAAVVLIAHAAGVANDTTITWSVIYLLARIVHYFGYLSTVPFVRTGAFAVGWLAIMVIFLQIVA